MNNVFHFPKSVSAVKSFRSRFLLLLLLLPLAGMLLMTPSPGRASTVPLNAKGIYSTTADDGSTIMLYRYAPYTTGTPAFRTSGTPILLFTGIVENMNQYMACTPWDLKLNYSTVYVPPLALAPSWAKTSTGRDWETYIKADKMRYYSLAHYLWLQGYDVWLANYRDTGRAPMRSQGPNPRAMDTLDTWATLDTPAAIAKVNAVTGKRMFIGGHSTAGLVSYAYLQGCYLDYGNAETAAEKRAYYQLCYALGHQPHVKADAALAKTRNASIRGYIGLDPAGMPPLPTLIDLYPIWTALSSKLYLPLDDVSVYLLQSLPGVILIPAEVMIFGAINVADAVTRAAGVGDVDNLFKYLDLWRMVDTDPCVADFMARFGLSGVALRGLGQYMDNGLHQTIREHYLNGFENAYSTDFFMGPTPNPGKDGYYYYTLNMSRMTVPMIVFSSTQGSLVTPQATWDTIVSKKSPTKYDKWYVLSNTAHVDLVLGRKMTTTLFPQLGSWLKTVNALSSNPANTTTPAARVDE
jgi:hypothetical protein